MDKKIKLIGYLVGYLYIFLFITSAYILLITYLVTSIMVGIKNKEYLISTGVGIILFVAFLFIIYSYKLFIKRVRHDVKKFKRNK